MSTLEEDWEDRISGTLGATITNEDGEIVLEEGINKLTQADFKAMRSVVFKDDA